MNNLALTNAQAELVERVAHVTGANIFDIIARVERLGREYGIKKAAVDLMIDQKKILLARLHEEARVRRHQAGVKSTEKQLENIALTQEEYINHCEAVAHAQQRLAATKEEYFAARNAREAMEQMNQIYRSELYSQR